MNKGFFFIFMRLIYIKLQFSNAILLCQTICWKENVICIYNAKNKKIYIQNNHIRTIFKKSFQHKFNIWTFEESFLTASKKKRS